MAVLVLVVVEVAVDVDSDSRDLCIAKPHNLKLYSLGSSADGEVLQFLVIFSFVLVIFAHFLQYAHVSYEPSNNLDA